MDIIREIGRGKQRASWSDQTVIIRPQRTGVGVIQSQASQHIDRGVETQ